jgi:CPA2 family monovalent cation:H+ antiporter-2
MAAAGVSRARLVVLAFDGEREAERILHCTRADAPQAFRLANAMDEDAAVRLRAAGADLVFPESLAAGVGLAGQSLVICGLDQTAVTIALADLRDEMGQEPALS